MRITHRASAILLRAATCPADHFGNEIFKPRRRFPFSIGRWTFGVQRWAFARILPTPLTSVFYLATSTHHSRLVSGSAHHSEADQTSDRAGAARGKRHAYSQCTLVRYRE